MTLGSYLDPSYPEMRPISLALAAAILALLHFAVTPSNALASEDADLPVGSLPDGANEICVWLLNCWECRLHGSAGGGWTYITCETSQNIYQCEPIQDPKSECYMNFSPDCGRKIEWTNEDCTGTWNYNGFCTPLSCFAPPL